MKKPLKLTLLILLFIQTHAFASQKIPEKLHGYWLFDVRHSGQWDAILVGENYVEFLYDLYTVRSWTKKENSYHFVLYNELKGAMTVDIRTDSAGQGEFKFSRANRSIFAKRRNKHPDMVYFSHEEMHLRITGAWKAIGNPDKEFRVKDKKMELDGKEWDILSFAEYMEKEYRALLRNGDHYRLVYFKKRGQVFNIGGDGRDVNYIKKASDVRMYQTRGNWLSPKGLPLRNI